jgi:tRNA 2-thiouridine synthesizing protein E
MKVEVDGKEVPTTDTGFLTNLEDWNEEVAKVIAEQESIELSQRHWDVINYLRDEFINNKENQPNLRNMVKDLGKMCKPDKQAGRIGGLPESRRKGGY